MDALKASAVHTHQFATSPVSFVHHSERSVGIETHISAWPPRKPSRRSNDASLHSTAHNPPMALLKQVLDQIGHGVLLVTEEAQVRHANRAAVCALRSASGLAFEHTLMRCRDPWEQAALLKALAACRVGRRSMVSVCASGADPILLAVIPIIVGANSNCNCDGVVALVTLSKRQVCDALGLQFFAQTHQLTTAEGRVLQRLCEGLRAAEIAAQGGVALSTVRSQIRSICQKTQASGIRALIGLVNLLPPMACPLEGPSSSIAPI